MLLNQFKKFKNELESSARKYQGVSIYGKYRIIGRFKKYDKYL